MGVMKYLNILKNVRWLGFGTSLNSPLVLPLFSNLDLVKGTDREIYKFDGEDDYIDFGDVASLDGLGAIRIETQFLVKSWETSADMYIITKRTGTSDSWNLRVDDNKRLYFTIDTGSPVDLISTNDIELNTVYTVICTWDGTTMYMSIDGIEKTVGQTGTMANTSESILIGAEPKAIIEDFFLGDIYYCKVYTDETTDNLELSVDLTSSKLGDDGVKDLSGNGNHGTSYGKGEFTRTTTATVKDHNGVLHKVGIDKARYEGSRFINNDKGFSEYVGENAIKLIGNSTDVVLVPYNTSLSFSGNDEISICGWFKWDVSASGNEAIISQSTEILIDKTVDSLRWVLNSFSTNDRVTGITNIADNNWHFVSAVYDGTDMILYFDGIEDGRVTPTGTYGGNTSDFRIGDGLDEWTGLLDNIVIWKGVGLSGEQVMQQYLFSKKGSNYLVAPENVVGAWKLDDTSSTIVDYSGNGNDGTFYSGGSPATPTLVEGVYDSGTKIDGDTLKGILVEEQRTNLLDYSEDFSQGSGFSLSNSTTQTLSSESSPIGGFLTKLIAPVGTSNYGFSIDNITTTDNTDYTFSIIAKADEFQWCRLATSDKSGVVVITWFDVLNGVIGTEEAGHTSTIEELSNGSYRCSVTRNVGTGANVVDLFFRMVDNDNVTSGIGNGSDGILVDARMFEKGSFASSYISTTTAAVTRTADVCSYDVSDIIEQGQGSIYAEFECDGKNTDTFPVLLSLNNGTQDNRLLIFIGDDADCRVRVDTATVKQLQINAVQTPGFNTLVKVLVSYKDNEVKLYQNGEYIGVDTTVTIPTNLTQLDIGNELAGSYYLNGTIKTVKYWKNTTSDAEGERLTKL